MSDIKHILPKYADSVIVGAGLGGLAMGIQLQEKGRGDYIIIEKGHEVGGTWRDNSYPGCGCDVQSHLYSYSFTDKADWKKRYGTWDEIQNYILETVEKFDVRKNVRFGLEVNSAVFDEQSALWTVGTSDGQSIRCRFFILASGPLHHPQIPDIKGLDKFKGKVMHSAQWDHNYDLAGKRVASIGTGGSAIQYAPEIADKVAKLDVYQRSAAWVIPRDERHYSDFTKWVFKTFPSLRKLYRARLYLTNEMRVWPIFNPAIAKVGEMLAKQFIKYQVQDPELRKKLTPDYTLGCKRILISNKWYPMFNKKNVELVTDAIQEIKENSIVDSHGVEREVDTIILGTGFIVDPRGYMQNFNMKGLPGHDILQDWKDGAEAYLGNTVHGYPNFFQLVGPNSGLGHNSIIFMIEAQVHYIIQCMNELQWREARYLNVKKDAQDKFNAEVQKRIQGTVWASGCRSWYQQSDGKNFVLWPASTLSFRRRNQVINGYHYDWVGAEDRAGISQANEATA
ncbi:MAG: NAD(P)/FAD-dependent oxidoreductase [Venatoribacter sp.]